MLRTKLFVATAALLSAVAALGAWLKPVVSITPLRASAGSLITLDVRPSHHAVHVGGSELFVEATVTASKDLKPERGPISFVLVLDRSGSMQGSKLDDAKRAAHALVDQLGAEDELGLVHFGSDVQSTWRRQMDAEGKSALHKIIDAVESSGATNISGGLEAALEQVREARGSRRVVLVSDGQPTAGVTNEDQLISLGAGRLHDAGATLTTLGVGADYNGMLMQHLSERGGGSYGYLRDAGTLAEILGKELDAARNIVARNVVLEVDSRAGLVVESAPGRWLERRDGKTLVHLADLQPGMTTKVYVSVRSLRNANVAALGLGVRYSRGERDEATGVARLDFPVVEDAAQVAAARDEAVYSRGVSAVGSLNLVAAAAAYERGDLSLADSLLNNTRALFATSADALAGEAEVQSVRKSFGSASATERKHLARDLERKKLSNFGRENEGY